MRDKIAAVTQAMSARLAPLTRYTIWNPSNHSYAPERFAGLYTVMYPFIYGVYAAYGALSVPLPVPSIDALFGAQYGDFWSYALAFCALGAFVGQVVRFPAGKDWGQRVEMLYVSFLLVLLGLYLVSILVVGINGMEPVLRYQAILAIAIFCAPPVWKAHDLVRELRTIRADREVVAARASAMAGAIEGYRRGR